MKGSEDKNKDMTDYVEAELLASRMEAICRGVAKNFQNCKLTWKGKFFELLARREWS